MRIQGTSSQAPPAPPAPPVPGQIREQVRRAIEEARAGAEDAAASAEAAAAAANQNQNRVVIRGGHPVGADVQPGRPGSTVHIGGMGPMIPPQAVDIANGFFTMCAVMVVGWPLARAFGRRLERAGPASAAAVAPAMSEQLQRIEQAVEAMSIEVERISESQRFLAKLQNAPLTAHAALPGRDQG